MTKTILMTGATDGIGLEASKRLAKLGHNVLLHGRNPTKLEAAAQQLAEAGGSQPETYIADLSDLDSVDRFAAAVVERHQHLDVLINNAGVLNAADPITGAGIDIRFMVNAVAPYRLTQQLLALFETSGRIINLSSAAQAPVDLAAFSSGAAISDMEAYAQSKLAITMWSRHLARQHGSTGPSFVAVNPGSLLATKMVKDGFGVAGNDIGIGADILVRAATGDDFAAVSGQYFDNDSGQFAPPHADALDDAKVDSVVAEVARWAMA